MSEEETGTQEEQVQQLYAFVAAEMKTGANKADIAAKLQEQGVGRTDAEQMVDTIYREIAAVVQKEQFTPGALMPAVVAGILAAALGGAVWAGIVVVTDYEVGFVAWGIGALCGFTVVLATRGRKGRPLQIVAVASSVLGILIGKYFTFYYFLTQMVADEQGTESVDWASALSPEVIQIFTENIGSMLGAYDLLWVGLAVFTAWGIPRGSGISVPDSAAGPIN